MTRKKQNTSDQDLKLCLSLTGSKTLCSTGSIELHMMVCSSQERLRSLEPPSTTTKGLHWYLTFDIDHRSIFVVPVAWLLLRALAQCKGADASLGPTIQPCLSGPLARSHCTALQTWFAVPPNERAARVCGRGNSKHHGDNLGSRRRSWFAPFIGLALATMQTPRVSQQLTAKSAKWKSFLLFHVTTAAKTSRMTVGKQPQSDPKTLSCVLLPRDVNT